MIVRSVLIGLFMLVPDLLEKKTIRSRTNLKNYQSKYRNKQVSPYCSHVNLLELERIKEMLLPMTSVGRMEKCIALF